MVDWGAGGGLPAVPLAIAFPEATFYAVDAVGKKIQVVRTVARRLGLERLYAWHGRAEQWPGRAHFSVSRATAPLVDLWRWHARIAKPHPERDERSWPSGLICLKGGDLQEEMTTLKVAFPATQVRQEAAWPHAEHRYFANKYVLTVTSQKE